METLRVVVEYIVQAGAATVLLLAILGGAKGWWVFGHTFTDMKSERDGYRKQVDDLMAIMIQRELVDHVEPMNDDLRRR
jgi:hypothetical protein